MLLVCVQLCPRSHGGRLYNGPLKSFQVLLLLRTHKGRRNMKDVFLNAAVKKNSWKQNNKNKWLFITMWFIVQCWKQTIFKNLLKNRTRLKIWIEKLQNFRLFIKLREILFNIRLKERRKSDSFGSIYLVNTKELKHTEEYIELQYNRVSSIFPPTKTPNSDLS